jgi:hypothetical protein
LNTQPRILIDRLELRDSWRRRFQNQCLGRRIVRRTLFDSTARTALLARLDALEPDRRPKWGRMSAPDMIWHVSAALRHSLGDAYLGDPKGVLARAPSGPAWGVLHHRHLDHHFRQFGV